MSGRRGWGGGNRRGTGFRGIGGGFQEPLRDTRRALNFNGSVNTGTGANTAGNADALIAAATQHSQKWTVAFWCKPYSTTQAACFIGNTNGSADRWAVATGGVSGWGRPRAWVGTATPGASFIANDLADAAVLAVGTWTHIAVVYDLTAGTQATRIQMYINGAEVACTTTGSIPGSVATNAANTNMGQPTGHTGGQVVPFHGALRDVRIWAGEALSASDIATVYTGGAVAGEDHRWTMDGTLNDAVGSAHGTKNPAAPAGAQYVMVTDAYPAAFGRRVLALGDSITAGSIYAGAWRPECQLQLWHHHGKRADFVGPQTDLSAAGQVDIDHAGVSGRKIGSSASDTGPPASGRNVVVSYLSTYVPDVLVLLLGTNEIGASVTGADAGLRMEAMLDEIYAVRANSFPVRVCTVPQRNAALNAETLLYNAALVTLVAADAGAGRNVVLVETEASEGGTRGLSADNVHPERAMYEKFGIVIAAAIQGLL